jgi:CRP-like cAMP-binding protein
MEDRKYSRKAEEARAKEVEEDVGRLRDFPAFAKFTDKDLKRLVQTAHRTSTSGPWPLIQEQTPSDSCYILLSGEAGVYVGKDRVALVGPGEVIGESSLLHGKLRNATVTTTGRAEVLHVARDALERLLNEIPALREAMDATVARHTPREVAEPGR